MTLLSGLDIWLWLTAVTQFFLAVLGIAVALKEDWAKKHMLVVISAFVVLGLGGLVATIRSGQEPQSQAQILSMRWET